MGMDALIQAMKAAGEPTRLRILLVLERSELTVSDAETVQVIRHMLMSGNFFSENHRTDFDFD